MTHIPSSLLLSSYIIQMSEDGAFSRGISAEALALGVRGVFVNNNAPRAGRNCMFVSTFVFVTFGVDASSVVLFACALFFFPSGSSTFKTCQVFTDCVPKITRQAVRRIINISHQQRVVLPMFELSIWRSSHISLKVS